MKKLLTGVSVLLVSSFLVAQPVIGGELGVQGIYTDAGVSYTDLFALDVGYATEDGFAVLSARIETEPVSSSLYTMPHAFATLSFLDGKALVSAGRIVNEDYDITTGISDDYLGNVANNDGVLDGFDGYLVQFLPLEGLLVGASFIPTGSDAEAADFAAYLSYVPVEGFSAITEASFGASFEETRMSSALVVSALEGITATAGYKHSALDTAAAFGILAYASEKFSAECAVEYDIDGEALYVEGYIALPASSTVSVYLLGASDADGLYLGDASWFAGLELVYAARENVSLGTAVVYDDDIGISVPLSMTIVF